MIRLIAYSVLNVMSTLIFIAALASWIPQVRYSKIGEILHMLTEPVIGPVRRLLRRIPALQRLPMDFSPLVTYLILVVIGQMIRMI